MFAGARCANAHRRGARAEPSGNPAARDADIPAQPDAYESADQYPLADAIAYAYDYLDAAPSIDHRWMRGDF